MEELSDRIQTAVENWVNDIDRTVSRPQQKAAYKCCYECFKDERRSREAVQQCLETCRITVERTDAIVSGELTHFQERLQRCALQCQDRAQALAPPEALQGGTQAQAEAQRQMAACVRGCAEDQLSTLPRMAERIKYQANR